jgi:hypothetical protein
VLPASRTVVVVLLVFTAVARIASASACGFEDPSSIAALRGGLALSYPQSLYVGTAVWQAQLADRLPRDPLAQRADLSPEQRGAMRLARARVFLAQFADRLGAAPAASGRPGLAVVLTGPVLWSRFDATGATVDLQLHATGPRDGDVVIVTDLAPIEAIARGELDPDVAAEAGWMRFYGPAAQVEAARAWLRATARGAKVASR